MASTYTTNKSFELPAHNDYINTWEIPVNGDFTFADTAFGGSTSINATSASGTVTLTATQYRPPLILISGTLTADVNYQLPSGIGGTWMVKNGTTGAHTITFSSAGAGTSVVITQGTRVSVYSDGTNTAITSTAAAGTAGQVQYSAAGVLSGASNIFSDGTNVGINNVTPGSSLDVKGTLRLTGSSSGYVGFAPAAAAGSATYTLPSADGASGTFLTTNGSAVLSWTGVTTGVSSFSAGTTGFTPSTASTGAVVLAGKLGLASGGTNADLSATGGTAQVLQQATVGAAVTVGQLAASALSNGTTGTGAVVLATNATIGLANGTGLPISTGVSGLGTGVATFLATPSSANLAAALTDETGSGSAVFATSPTLVTPVLGVATATTINKVTLTQPASGSTLTIIDGKTLTQSKTMQFTAADDTGVYTFPTGTKTLVDSTVTSLSALATVGTITSGIWNAGAVTSSGAVTDLIGNVRTIPPNAQTTGYTLQATDNGKYISITTGGVTVPNSIFSVGQIVSVFNNSGSSQTITQGSGVTMYFGGTSSTGSRTLPLRGLCTILCVVDTSHFVITGTGIT